MNAFRHLKNFVENLESRYETWWWTRNYPNLSEELEKIDQNFLAGRGIPWVQIKKELFKEGYDTGGDESVRNRVLVGRVENIKTT